jgi:methylenetetrahydrofolate reductase (NADH)
MRSPAPGRPARNRDAAAAACSALLADFSLDITSEELGELVPARTVIPAGTPVQLAFPDSADLAERASTAGAIKEAGFAPVPIIAARRLRSQNMLREYLAALQAADASESVLVVAGDPVQPQGPYPDAASVIGSGLLEEHGVRQAGVAGHPGGHPAVADGALWAALATKTAARRQRGLGGDVITQFGFDAAQVLAWLSEVRARGIGLPVRVSVPGPATVRRLLAIASRCGVTVSAPVAREYGFSLTEPAGTARPDRFIATLASGYDRRLHGEVKLHFNAFGGFSATAEWISRFRGRHSRSNGGSLPAAPGAVSLP